MMSCLSQVEMSLRNRFFLAFLMIVAIVPGVSQTNAGPIQTGALQEPGHAVTTSSGLRYIDLVVGGGRKAELGDTATVHYTGWLIDGTKFDSSVDRGEPFSFRVGSGMVIKGWDEGVSTMRKGGKRKLIIPPHLAYGTRGVGNIIPPDATLTFIVELLDLR